MAAGQQGRSGGVTQQPVDDCGGGSPAQRVAAKVPLPKPELLLASPRRCCLPPGPFQSTPGVCVPPVDMHHRHISALPRLRSIFLTNIMVFILEPEDNIALRYYIIHSLFISAFA